MSMHATYASDADATVAGARAGQVGGGAHQQPDTSWKKAFVGSIGSAPCRRLGVKQSTERDESDIIGKQ